MILSEYHTTEVLRMNARRCLNLLDAAIKRRNARDLFFRWVIEGFSTKMPFDEFMAKLKPQKKQSADEILTETKKLMENATWQHHSLSL